MSRNPVLYKSLVVGVIFLFIGMGIQPAFAIVPKINDNDDDCDLCPSVKINNVGDNSTICGILISIVLFLGIRGAIIGTIYALLLLLPFNTLLKIYQKYFLIRTSNYLYILDNILDWIIKFECGAPN